MSENNDYSTQQPTRTPGPAQASQNAYYQAPPTGQQPVSPYAQPQYGTNPPGPTMQQGPYDTHTPDGRKLVNKVAYVLLALFLGGLGIHNFYAGKFGLGVLYLVFCWTFIPAIAALVQAIIATCKTSDAYGRIAV